MTIRPKDRPGVDRRSNRDARKWIWKDVEKDVCFVYASKLLGLSYCVTVTATVTSSSMRDLPDGPVTTHVRRVGGPGASAWRTDVGPVGVAAFGSLTATRAQTASSTPAPRPSKCRWWCSGH
jgi:hypothetical protein